MPGVERNLAGEKIFHRGDVGTTDDVIPYNVVPNRSVLMTEDIPSASETRELYIWVIGANFCPVFVLREPVCGLADFLKRSHDRVLAHFVGKKFFAANAVDEAPDERESFGDVI